MIGQVVSHYRVLEKLGEGGMGVVYLAEDTRLGRKVALKALSPEFAGNPDRRKRFQQEARAAAVLTHPGIATVYELEEVGENLFIVFEYVEGDNLRAVIDRGPLELDALFKTATDIARALAAAHSHGIVHRDLKPENVIRTAEGDPKILDFGLARFQPGALDADHASTRLTDPGSIVGTISYMAPEQLEGKDADFRSDIFSFGILVYELATGIRPFEGTSRASTISRILSAEPVSLLQRNPVAPPELDRIVRKCLRKRPEERYQSTRDLVVDLETLRRESDISSRPVDALSSEVDEGLLQRPFRLVAPTPRRWWEANQLCYVVFNAVLVYIGWKVKEWTPGTWGLALFLVVVVLAAASTSFRVILLGTGVVTPANLTAEVRRLGRWTRLVDLTFTALLVVLAGTILSSHPGVAALLVGMAVAGAVAFLIIDPTLTRAAFPRIPPSEGAAEVRPSVTRKARLIAVLQAIYLAPAPIVAYLVADLFSWYTVSNQALAGVALYVAGAVLIAASTVSIWREEREGIERFHRWFYLYLLLDFIGIGAAVGLLTARVHLALALLLLPLLAYLPFYQRRLAREILGTLPAELAAKPGWLTRLKHLLTGSGPYYELGLTLVLQAVYHVAVLYFLTTALLPSKGVRENLLFSAWVVFVVAAGINAGIVREMCRGNRQWMQHYCRWFPLFVVLDLAGAAVVAALNWAQVAEMPPVVAVLILGTVALMRFHQRRLAKKLLAA
jgi:predicted Ser/Thr protein kinase